VAFSVILEPSTNATTYLLTFANSKLALVVADAEPIQDRTK